MEKPNMAAIFSKPKAPVMPAIEEPEEIPVATDDEALVAKKKEVAKRMAMSGRTSTALSEEKKGL